MTCWPSRWGSPAVCGRTGGRTGCPPGTGGGGLPPGYGEEGRGLSRWWKLAAARAVAEAEPGRRIVWIDDDLADQAQDTSEWLAAHEHVLGGGAHPDPRA